MNHSHEDIKVPAIQRDSTSVIKKMFSYSQSYHSGQTTSLVVFPLSACDSTSGLTDGLRGPKGEVHTPKGLYGVIYCNTGKRTLELLCTFIFI